VADIDPPPSPRRGDLGWTTVWKEIVSPGRPPGRDGIAIDPGTWETSGIIDVSSLFGADTWIFDVQAHSPTAAPGPKAVEDGQLVLMRPAN
jgi:hypothetical protein